MPSWKHTGLTELTNNILIASQLDSGNYSLNKQVVNLSELTGIAPMGLFSVSLKEQ